MLTKSRSAEAARPKYDGVLFAERANESEYLVLPKPLWGVGPAKASVNSANLSNIQDPKPDELAMSRMNPAERRGEVRTSEMCNPLG